MRVQLTFTDTDGPVIVEKRDFDADSDDFIKDIVEAVTMIWTHSEGYPRKYLNNKFFLHNLVKLG